MKRPWGETVVVNCGGHGVEGSYGVIMAGKLRDGRAG